MTESANAYFEHTAVHNRYRSTELTTGAWNDSEMHIAPVIGLIAHAAEREHASNHETPLMLTRLSVDILGTIPLGELDLQITTLRPGKTIELIEVVVSPADARPAAVARIWFSANFDTASLANSDSFAPITPREKCQEVDPAKAWKGGFVRSLTFWGAPVSETEKDVWLHTSTDIVAGENTSATARLLGVCDSTNGVSTRLNPAEVAFPNIDLTAHLFRAPAGSHLGARARSAVGPAGHGLNQTVLYDDEGAFGILAQQLTVRPFKA